MAAETSSPAAGTIAVIGAAAAAFAAIRSEPMLDRSDAARARKLRSRRQIRHRFLPPGRRHIDKSETYQMYVKRLAYADSHPIFRLSANARQGDGDMRATFPPVGVQLLGDAVDHDRGYKRDQIGAGVLY